VDLAPVLPKLLAACAEFGAEPTALDLDQPTLERVFLHLTGRGLRD
jgi:ABC-2 type transport system ATP-binding protein